MGKIIITFIFVLYPLVIFWNKKLKNNYYAELYMGLPGSGKTGLCTKFVIQNNLTKEFDRVYCTIDIPGCYTFDSNDIKYHKYKFMQNSLVLIDEAGILFSNREFRTIDKDTLAWFKYLRHNRCRVKLFSQSADIDLKIRQLCSVYHIIGRFLVFTTDRIVYRTIDVGEDADGNGRFVENFKKAFIIGGLRLHYLPRYVNLWDTYNHIKVPLIPSHYIQKSPQFMKSLKMHKWYVQNFRDAYSRQFRDINTASDFIKGQKYKSEILMPFSRWYQQYVIFPLS